MAIRKKWYNNKIFYAVVFLTLVTVLIFGVRKSKVFLNYTEFLKTENNSLRKEIDSLKVDYEKLDKQRQKTKIIRDKITTVGETEKIKQLEKELDELWRQKRDTIIGKDTPIELYKYFNK